MLRREIVDEGKRATRGKKVAAERRQHGVVGGLNRGFVSTF